MNQIIRLLFSLLLGISHSILCKLQGFSLTFATTPSFLFYFTQYLFLIMMVQFPILASKDLPPFIYKLLKWRDDPRLTRSFQHHITEGCKCHSNVEILIEFLAKFIHTIILQKRRKISVGQKV